MVSSSTIYREDFQNFLFKIFWNSKQFIFLSFEKHWVTGWVEGWREDRERENTLTVFSNTHKAIFMGLEFNLRFSLWCQWLNHLCHHLLPSSLEGSQNCKKNLISTPDSLIQYADTRSNHLIATPKIPTSIHATPKVLKLLNRVPYKCNNAFMDIVKANKRWGLCGCFITNNFKFWALKRLYPPYKLKYLSVEA